MSNEDNRDQGALTSRNSLGRPVEAQGPQAEDELRAIIDNAPVFLWSDLPDGYCDFLNQRWLTYFNLSLQEAQGTGWATLLHPDDAAHHLENWQKSISTGVPLETETRFRGADGEYRWFLTRANPLRDKTGRIVKWYGTNIDIENLKRTERKLRQSEANLAEAQRLSHTGSWALSPAETKILYWSEECYRIWGFDPMQGLPNRETVWRRIHPGDRDRVYEEAQEALRQKRDSTIEFRIVLPDGAVKYLKAIGHHLFSERGELIQIVGTNVDVTERKCAEEALRESEYKLRQIIETVPSLLWSLAPDGEPTHFNQRFLEYFGKPFEDFKHGGWLALIHPDDVPETERTFFHAIQNGTSYRGVLRFRQADGEYRWHEGRGEPLRDQEGRIVQWYGLSIDIDEAKKAEEQLRRSEAYLSEAQRLSHTGTWVLNPTAMQYLYWSHESYRIWGFDPLQGPPSRDALWQRIHDRDKVWEEVQEALRQKKDYSGEFKIVLPDGTVKYLAATSHHLFSTNGEIAEVIGTNVDVTERKRAEQALRESEAKIRRLVDANIIGIFIWDFDGRILEANEAFLDIVGYDHEDLVARRIRWTDLTPPEWQDRDARLIQEHMVTGTLQPFEKEYFRKDGSRVPVLIGVATFEESGNQGVAFVLDLTERKRAEEALRESERSSRAAIDGIAGLVAIMAPNGELDALNRQVIDYFGRSLEEMKNWGTSDAVHPEDLPRIAEIFQRSIAAGTPFNYELRLRRFDGEYRWFDNRCVPIREKSGRIVRWYMLGTDVEDRKRAEEGLRESETKFRDYAETASDWFWEAGPDYKFTLLTENAFGSDSADRIGTACWEHALDLETEPEKWRLIQATLDARKPFRDFVYCSARGGGSPMYVKASGKPVFDANGRFRGYRGTGTDVTALIRGQEEHERLRQLESDLAHMNRLSMMGELAASLAHEIAQPVTTARNNARAAMHFLDRSSPNLDQVREAIACVVDDADRAADILDRIRDQIKKAPPRKERVDLNQAINDVVALAQGAIVKNGVSVQTHLTERLSDVQADCVQLQQVVLNLILNAVEAMSSVKKGARELSIGTEPHQAGGVMVTVRDSGPGIDPEHLNRVFDAFYTTKSSGVGMGLSICQSIIHAHGGRLWADVNAPRGAVFRFTLPSAEKELMGSGPAGHQAGEPNEGTVRDAPR